MFGIHPYYIYFVLSDLLCFSFGLGLGIFGMVMFYVYTSGDDYQLLHKRSPWRKLRSRYRPLLWKLGLDWTEIKTTYKRVFLAYYGRRLPEYAQRSQQLAEQLDWLEEEQQDETAAILSADYALTKSTPATPPATTSDNE